MAGYTFHLEHIIPSTRGGSSQAPNRALACSPCNLAKGAETHATDPVTGQVVPLYNPRRDRWAVHFEPEPLSGRVQGLTAVGRATVEALDMNTPEHMATRRLWAAAGWWP